MRFWNRVGTGLAAAGRGIRSFVTGRPTQAPDVPQAKPKRASGVVVRCLRQLWEAAYSSGELAGALGLPLSTVTGALRYCKRAGFAERGEDGRWAITLVGRRRLELGVGRQRIRRAELGGG